MPIDPLALYRRAVAAPSPLAGYYNRNARLETSAGPVIVRIPIPGAARMDLSLWPEAEVLSSVGARIDCAPRLLHVGESPAFQVHEHVGGDVVDAVFPRGTRLPPRVLSDVVALFGSLARVPAGELPALPDDWPEGGDVVSVARRLSDVTAGVHDAAVRAMPGLYRDLGFPDRPLDPARAALSALGSRPFSLVHADVHRKNMIDTGSRTVFLDWELALWGDPVYDLAVNLHKMSYLPDERDAVVARWAEELPDPLTSGYRADIDCYLVHEEIKSAIVDSVRYTQDVASGRLGRRQEDALLAKLTAKVARAYRRWGLDSPPGRERVEDVVRSRRDPSQIAGHDGSP